MKLLLLSGFLFLFSCNHSDSKKSNEVSTVDTSQILKVLNSKPKQFECGTADLIKRDLEKDILKDPKNFKDVRFITTKAKFRQFVKIAKEDSLYLDSLDTKTLAEFYIPTKRDHSWLLIPSSEVRYIKKGMADSFPIKIFYAIDDAKRFNITLAADSTITNQLAKIISQNKLGKLVAAKPYDTSFQIPQ